MGSFYLYNTLTRSRDEFVPLNPPSVSLYCCGPTVYDYAHIGNYRTFIFTDLLRRSLLLHGFEVKEVMNITDVDDKTIEGASRAGLELSEYTARYEKAFFDDLGELRIQKAEYYPRATEHIDEIIGLVSDLEQKGFAYRSSGSVYYRISEFANYGRLSRLDSEGIRAGARVDHDDYDKESVNDFVLWKGGKNEAVQWDSPWGPGRPGWHIECSAMSMKYLGQTIDIHCGGVDLCFPHHENEIAQSEAASGKQFVKNWLHAEHLLVEGQKMSKSLGNFYTFRDLREKGYKSSAIRYLLLSTHYRSQLNFSFDAVHAASSAVERLRDFKLRLEDYQPPPGKGQLPHSQCIGPFKEALADDLAISNALAILFEYVREVNRMMDQNRLSDDGRKNALEELSLCDTVLDVLDPDPAADDEVFSNWVDSMIEERSLARKEKNFSRADEIRELLASKGVILEDSSSGTRWKRNN